MIIIDHNARRSMRSVRKEAIIVCLLVALTAFVQSLLAIYNKKDQLEIYISLVVGILFLAGGLLSIFSPQVLWFIGSNGSDTDPIEMMLTEKLEFIRKILSSRNLSLCDINYALATDMKDYTVACLLPVRHETLGDGYCLVWCDRGVPKDMNLRKLRFRVSPDWNIVDIFFSHPHTLTDANLPEIIYKNIFIKAGRVPFPLPAVLLSN